MGEDEEFAAVLESEGLSDVAAVIGFESELEELANAYEYLQSE